MVYEYDYYYYLIKGLINLQQVRDKDGKMRWQRVEVKLEEHVKIPKFPETTNSSSIELYDNYVSDYITSILTSRTPQDKPLWEIHLIKYPTSNAEGTLIFKLHHALGDGYSLMGALLSCLQRADDPSLPLSCPSRKPSQLLSPKKGFFKWFPSTIFSFFNSFTDFGWSIAKSSMIKDDKTPIWNGEEGVESHPCVLSNLSFSLDEIKTIKSKLGVVRLIYISLQFAIQLAYVSIVRLRERLVFSEVQSLGSIY